MARPKCDTPLVIIIISLLFVISYYFIIIITISFQAFNSLYLFF